MDHGVIVAVVAEKFNTPGGVCNWNIVKDLLIVVHPVLTLQLVNHNLKAVEDEPIFRNTAGLTAMIGNRI
jgi:hypothetical protein